jgi:hypothetical protein
VVAYSSAVGWMEHTGQALAMSLPGIGSATVARHSGWPKVFPKVLSLMDHPPIGELHDAHGVAGLPVVRDDVFAHPQIPTADDPEDGEVSIGSVCAALRRNLVAAPESFT